MFQRLRQLLPYVALLALALPALQALTPGVLCADDLGPHIHKAYALERLILDGHFLPRWSPDMGRGFGYPLFNFYAPLSSYPLAFLHLAGVPYSIAIQFLLGLYVWLAGVAMFVFARDLFDAAAGWVAAAVYMYAPYLAYDVLYRGALAEASGWPWVPLLLWALRRAMLSGSWRWSALAGLCYAALLPSHNLLAILASPLAAGWVLVLAVERRDWRRVRFGLAALGLGLGLAAAFWLPALAERDFVRVDRLLASPVLRYANNFVGPRELVTQAKAFDPLLVNPSPPRGLGAAAAILSLAGLLALARRPFRRHALVVGYFAFGLAAYGLTTLPISQPAWDRIPMLAFVQFPWRLLAPASACAAVLAGAAIRGWARGRWLMAGVSVVWLTAANLPWWHSTYCGSFGPETADAARQLRAGTFQEGAHGYSEYLPVWANTFPEEASLYEALVDGQRPDRLSIESPPAGTSAIAIRADPLDAEYRLSLPQAAEVVYRQFYYPGWSVEIDNAAAELWPNAESGLITFGVPAGEHIVRVRWGETRLRMASDVVSILAIVLCFALLRRPDRSPRPVRSRRSMDARMAILGLTLFTLRIGLIDRFPNPLRGTAFDGQQVRGSIPLRLSFAGGVEIFGFTLDSPVVASGDSFDVALFAGVRQSAERRYLPSVWLADEAGLRWSAPSEDFPRWLRAPYAASAWPPGRYALWARRIRVLPGTPPGTYQVWAAVFDQDTLAPDSVMDEQGNSSAPRFRVTEVRIARPPRPADPATLQMQFVSGAALGDAITLLGYNLDRAEARAGDTVLVTLFWRADRAPGQDLSVELRLLDAPGQETFSTSFSPTSEAFPTSLWRASDVWRGQHLIRLPADLSDGEHRWQIRFAGEANTAMLSPLLISAPERVFVAPPFQYPVGARVGDFAELTGYSLSEASVQPGDEVSLRLVWRAVNTPEASYSVFVHLADATGRVWAQSDGIPQDWQRPTAGWLAGEYIADARRLELPPDIPPGNYTLFVGMMEVATGERAPASGPGAEPDWRVRLGRVLVER